MYIYILILYINIDVERKLKTFFHQGINGIYMYTGKHKYDYTCTFTQNQGMF